MSEARQRPLEWRDRGRSGGVGDGVGSRVEVVVVVVVEVVIVVVVEVESVAVGVAVAPNPQPRYEGRVPSLDPSTLAGQLLVGGFDGPDLPDRFAAALRDGLRGGAILFRRNVVSLDQVAALARAIAASSPAGDPPPIVGIDEEGGRVSRLRGLVPPVPPALELAAAGEDAVLAAGGATGAALAGIGVTVDFAPVLDVHTNPANPVIGDRSFGTDPAAAARGALAFARGLAEAGVAACGKHFPGHGDTSVDSHLDLPRVAHARDRLDRVEIAPFRAAVAAGIPALMTAHVVYDALDPGVPATLSRRIGTDLLRREMGFAGVLFSDDLEMRAISGRGAIENAAVRAVEAGCDALLVCSDQDAQDRVHEALARRIETDAAFRARCEEAAARCFVLRGRGARSA